MASLADKAILSGADNRPHMLEKDMYDSWKSRMELYILNRQHGGMILELVEHGPLLWPTIEEDGVTRLKKYFELSSAEAIQADCDVKATNIILQALPSEIYALLRTSSNPRQQATINNGRVTIQPIQGRQNFMSAGSSRPFTSGSGGAPGKQRVIVCYNFKGKGHMSKQYTKPKRKQDAKWFKDKVLLVQAQANRQVLQEEELEFLADPRTAEANYLTHQELQVPLTSGQSNILTQSNTESTSDSNIISYSQYMNESQYNTVQNSTIPTLHDDLILYKFRRNFPKSAWKPKAANKKVPNKLEPNNSWESSSSNVLSLLLTCRDRSQLINFIQKFLGTVKFGKKVPNKLEPNNSWESSSSNVLSLLLTCRDRSQLINFIQKFLGTVKFGNDHMAKIMGYKDYQIGNATISRVYYVEGLGHNLFYVGQFCDSDLEVAFRQHTCFIRNLDGVDLLT
nr:integrase, catalytic region, zinc finger, CCHC-type, peptidase aspartic, catalytic [Tanacetum cinerariifolium]